jgi:outer membrane protein TolC
MCARSMSEYSIRNWLVGGLAGFLVFSASRPAKALQPLPAFLSAAKTANVDNKVAASLASQRAFEAEQAWDRLLPTLTMRASYTRNQYEAIARLPTGTATITPKNQLDAVFTLDVPLIDLGAWSKISAANANTEAAKARLLVSEDAVQKTIAQTYTRIVAAEALVDAAKRSIAAADANLKVVQLRKTAGTASDLDVERATAEVSRAEQNLADASYTEVTSRQALASLSGIVPTDGAPSLDDDLHAEAPLETWLGGSLAALPTVKAASLDVVAAKKNESAAWDALLPVVSATATEKFTNAVGFGTSPYWTAGVVATWKLDFGTYDGAKAFAAAKEGAILREEQAKITAHDAIFDAWHQVKSQIAKGTAARAEMKASAHAAQLARARYGIGTGTQLEVLQADRDAFAGEVARIQADADLVYARALLRIVSGRSPTIGGS